MKYNTQWRNNMSYCDNCQKEDVITEIREVPIEEEIDGDLIRVVSTMRFCKDCEHMVFDESLYQQAMVKIYNTYRRKLGLLMPEQIQEIRESYGLSQEEFDKLLNLEPNTIRRYENGSLQTWDIDDLIKLLKYPYFMRDYIHTTDTGLDDDRLKLLSNKVDVMCQVTTNKRLDKKDFIEMVMTSSLLIVLAVILITLLIHVVNENNDQVISNVNNTQPTGDYVIIRTATNGDIVDVFKLENIYTHSSPSSYYGITFVDSDKKEFMIHGDVKIMKLDPKSSDWNKYVEYHKEMDIIPYDEFYSKHSGE